MEQKAEKKYSKQQQVIIFVVVITAFITTFTGSALNLSVPDMGEHFGVSAATVGWVVTGYTLIVAAMSVPLGRIADLTGRKRILVLGILLFAISSLGAMFGFAMWMILLFRITQGIGGAMIFSTNTAVLISAFPGTDRGKVLGYSIASTYTGLSAGPVVGGVLNHYLGWRSIFALTALIAGIVLVIAWSKLPSDRIWGGSASASREDTASAGFGVKGRNHRQADGKGEPLSKKMAEGATAAVTAMEAADESRLSAVSGGSVGTVAVYGADDDRSFDAGDRETVHRTFDLAGSLLYIAMIVLIMYGLSEISMGILPVMLVLVGVAVAFFFVRRELSVADPVVQVRIFKENIAYSFSNLAALLNYGATFAISYLISIYLQVVMGYSSQTAGLILIVQPVIMAVLSPYAGRLSDRISPFRLASFGMGLCAVGVLIFSFVTAGSPLWIILVALAVTGVGFAFFSSPNTNAVMACVEPKDYGVASSILATMRSIGHTLSMVIVTFIVSRYMGGSSLAEADAARLVQVMHTAFLIFTGICVVGVFISLKRKRKS